MKSRLNEYLIIKNKIEKKRKKDILNISMGIKDKKKLNVVKMKYKIEEKTKNIRIFGKKFVNNNKKICMIILNNKIIEIKEFLEIIDS